MTTSTPTRPRPDRSPHATRTPTEDLVVRAHRMLDRHSLTLLRVSLGGVFLLFGALKFVPGLSPAADLAARTVEILTLGMVSGTSAVLLTAVTETFIGITLVTGRFLKAGLAVLALAIGGIMAPLVLFYDELFPAGPTIVGQYVLKDVVLLAAGLVVAAQALGARLTRD